VTGKQPIYFRAAEHLEHPIGTQVTHNMHSHSIFEGPNIIYLVATCTKFRMTLIAFKTSRGRRSPPQKIGLFSFLLVGIQGGESEQDLGAWSVCERRGEAGHIMHFTRLFDPAFENTLIRRPCNIPN
jgi:hypothetical protein